jgi:hypothetical protein
MIQGSNEQAELFVLFPVITILTKVITTSFAGQKHDRVRFDSIQKYFRLSFRKHECDLYSRSA